MSDHASGAPVRRGHGAVFSAMLSFGASLSRFPTRRFAWEPVISTSMKVSPIRNPILSSSLLLRDGVDPACAITVKRAFAIRRRRWPIRESNLGCCHENLFFSVSLRRASSSAISAAISGCAFCNPLGTLQPSSMACARARTVSNVSSKRGSGGTSSGSLPVDVPRLGRPICIRSDWPSPLRGRSALSTGFPAARRAQYPRGGIGIPALIHTFARPVSDMPSRFARAARGSLHTSSCRC